MERRRHNNRTLPEERPAGPSTLSSPSSTSIPSSTTSEASASTAATSTNGLAPVGHVGATTAGYGPLPSGWGKLLI
jgi:hypothetical protein